ncbi:MAG TPA: hypothetical protein VED17_05350 [Nitrososphaerales archaeon]|nr:hypothetical protein [Nitrososphaerales archaeon]
MEQKQSIREMVVESLGVKAAPIRRQRLVDSMVEEALDKQNAVLLKAHTAIEEQEGLVKSLSNPDVRNFSAPDSPPSTSFSEKRVGELKKAKERLVKLIAAFDRAMDQGDFKELGNLLNQGGPAKGTDGQ